MGNAVWIGGIYLKDEGGYHIVMRALQYYLKMLKNLSRGMGTTVSATLSHILQQEADRVGPIILQTGKDLKEGMIDQSRLAAVQNNLEYVFKALESYRAGVIADLKSQKPAGMIDAVFLTETEIARLDEAIRRIGEKAPHQEA